jgi:hypothetical protein
MPRVSAFSYDIETLKPLGGRLPRRPHRLDGAAAEVDLGCVLGDGPVFQPLRDPE